MAEPGATEAAAEQAAAAAHAETSKSKKNRVKKLKAQYVSILELESRVAAGHALDAGQAEKVSKAARPHGVALTLHLHFTLVVVIGFTV